MASHQPEDQRLSVKSMLEIGAEVTVIGELAVVAAISAGADDADRAAFEAFKSNHPGMAQGLSSFVGFFEEPVVVLRPPRYGFDTCTLSCWRLLACAALTKLAPPG